MSETDNSYEELSEESSLDIFDPNYYDFTDFNELEEYLDLYYMTSRQDEIDWCYISQRCSLESLEKYEDRILWFCAQDNPNISIELIRKRKDGMNWCFVSESCSLEVLLEFPEKVWWEFASRNRNITDNLIRKYQDKVDWYQLSKHCSLEIVKEFKDKIDCRPARHNSNISKELYIKMFGIMNFDYYRH